MSRGRLLVVGTGPGEGYLTARALELLRSGEVFVGGEAALAAAPAWGRRIRIAGPLEAVIAQVGEQLASGRSVCVLTSGDPGYFSMLAALERAFPGEAVVEPAVASVQLLAARLGVPWQEFVHFSVHGRGLELSPPDDRPSAVLCGGSNSPQAVAAHLLERGICGRAAVGVRLGWSDEQVMVTDLADVAGRAFGSPAVLALFPEAWCAEGGWEPRLRGEAPALGAGARSSGGSLAAPGIRDEEFERIDKVPLSRWEVRAVLAAVARPGDRRVIWDVGAGSGGFAVEMSLLSPLARVLAFEREEAGCRAIATNARRFGARVEVIQGAAPDVFGGVLEQAGDEGTPAGRPDLVVIGGSGGRLEAVLDSSARALNEGGRVIVTAVTLETAGIAASALGVRPWAGFDALQLASARHDKAGIMKGMNPVTFMWADKGGVS